MKEHGLYFGKKEYYVLIRKLGGLWNDDKERPIVCLIKSSECDNLYWAIPMGNLNHRDCMQKERIQRFLNYNSKDIRSCFYHIGKTDAHSIFFISDAIPITDTYIERTYDNKYTGKHHIIKNKKLLMELERKLKRILAWENANPNYFRQHITDIKQYLIREMQE